MCLLCLTGAAKCKHVVKPETKKINLLSNYNLKNKLFPEKK